VLGLGLWWAIPAAERSAGSREALGTEARGVLSETPTPGPGLTPTPTRTLPPTPTQGVNPLRNPYFGDMHVHTNVSFDSYLLQNPNGPQEAYQFARGQTLQLTGGQTLQLDKPLDWMAVTDHAEYFGEISICTDPNSPGYGQVQCEALRSSVADPNNTHLGALLFSVFGVKLTVSDPQHFQPLCGPNDVNCTQAARTAWQEFRSLADAFYEPGVFTTFLGYEYTGTPDPDSNPLTRDPIQMNHRNVIFQNTTAVPELPVTYFEAQTAQELWLRLRAVCRGDCQFLAVPHNPNYSNGIQFSTLNPGGGTLTAEQARLRAASEPLVEIIQVKGESECHPGLQTEDELCSFEKLDPVRPCDPNEPPSRFCYVECDANGQPQGCIYPRSFVRNALKAGLGLEEQIGVNPFRVGFIGSMDTHNAAAGGSDETEFKGLHGVTDDTPAERLDTREDNLRNNPGGLAVVWAEQNSRDAIFDAMKRRETYATSGTRPILRFFGGWSYPVDLCQQLDVIQQAYDGGVPMGSHLRYDASGQTPKFLGYVLKEPDGTNLDKIQLVKGWTESGQGQEAVYDLACSDGRVPDPVTHLCPPHAGTVDLQDCSIDTNVGASELCALGEDPDFDPNEHAFYYLRALEMPTCRWSNRDCIRAYPGLDCDATFTQQGLNPCDLPPDLADPNDPNDPNAVLYSQAACCCAGVPKTIQERAWSSPIWYNPAEFVGAVREAGLLALAALGLLLAARRMRRRA
jgi:hypothetical protein